MSVFFRLRTFEKRRSSLTQTVVKTVNVKECQPGYLSFHLRLVILRQEVVDISAV